MATAMAQWITITENTLKNHRHVTLAKPSFFVICNAQYLLPLQHLLDLLPSLIFHTPLWFSESHANSFQL